MKTVIKLLYERRSIRQFTDKPVPEEMIREIINAGLMAHSGLRMWVRQGSLSCAIQKSGSWLERCSMENGVIILICTDVRVYAPREGDGRGWSPARFPHNIYYGDAATEADHMCLMAHALGLGACWLTHGEENAKEDTRALRAP